MAAPDETAVLVGASGTRYQYGVYTFQTTFNAIFGNYAFARRNGFHWYIIYVGETSEFSTRFASHPKMACAIRHQATHILARVSSPEQSVRTAEESDLRRALNPPCNLQ